MKPRRRRSLIGIIVVWAIMKYTKPVDIRGRLLAAAAARAAEPAPTSLHGSL